MTRQANTTTTVSHHVVLRTRIGVHYPDSIERHDLTNALEQAIVAAVDALGAKLDVLQIDLAARPDWNGCGPLDRVTDRALTELPPEDSE